MNSQTMRDFLIEMFGFNTEANIRMTRQIESLDSRDECIRLLSHLANCQYKWLDRIEVFPSDSALDWWSPLYSLEELPHHFKTSAGQWIAYLSQKKEEDLDEIRHYVGYDGTPWEAKLRDIALQLNFHSFHHRAQMQMMIRDQGRKPAFIDFIGSKQKKSE